jgi:hypothetical protein
MSSQFRPTRPEDAGAVSQFMQRVFGMKPGNPSLALPQMHWKYWREHPEWEGSRGYALERDGQIVAHGSVVPLTCAWDGRRLKMVDLIDWAALPGNPGAGISLLKNVSKRVDGVFIAGGTQMAQKVFQSLGFRECAPAAFYALPLRPFARLLQDQGPMWKRAARLARNFLWKADSLGFVKGGWNARRLAADDVVRQQFPLPRGRAQAAIFERSAAGIAFLLDCPQSPAEFYLVEKDNSVAGYFVLTRALAQCRIAEAWVEPGLPEDWQTLYQLAIQRASQRRELHEIVAVVTNDAAAREGLRRCGFRPRGQTPLRFSISGGSYPTDIRYQMVDNDNAWLHDGETPYWT